MRVYWIRKIHRFLGLIIGLQLLLWTASGLFFSWNDIEKVRGEHLTAPPPALAPIDAAILSPRDALETAARRFPGWEHAESISLRTLLDDPVYEVRFRAEGTVRYGLIDARSGRLRSPLAEAEAVALAVNDFVPDADVTNVELLESVGSASEYRDRDLPAYRVDFGHPTGTRIYVSADRGLVTARRNNTWRVFDFLWMFHIMDYEARDDINNILLRVLSVSGLATVLSGYLLWGFTSRYLRRRTRARRGDLSAE